MRNRKKKPINKNPPQSASKSSPQPTSRSASASWPSAVFIYTDGACRGNPGPCSLGLKVLDTDQNPVYEESSFLESNNTNNFAEYKAVVRALELSCQHGVKSLRIYSDSLLIVRQLENKYKVKSANIKPLFLQCKNWMKKIPKVRFQHIPREQNIDADKLANKALDDKDF